MKSKKKLLLSGKTRPNCNCTSFNETLLELSVVVKRLNAPPKIPPSNTFNAPHAQ